MKKILMFLLCLFAFTVNLYAETYYDKEIVKVDTLPTASETTLDKVYQLNDKYYITNKVPGGLRNLLVGDNLKETTVYLDFPDNLYECLIANYNTSTSKTIIKMGSYSYNINYYSYTDNYYQIRGFYTPLYFYNNGSLNINKKSYSVGTANYDSDLIVENIYLENDKCNIYNSIKISMEDTYNWQEVNKLDVIKYESKIYIPEKERYKCFVVQSEGVIRGYEEIPQNNSTINYRDYYINSDYIFRDGHQTFGSNSSLPSCLSTDVITDEIYYRVDFYKILIMFLIISIVCIYLPLKIFFKLFKRGGF